MPATEARSASAFQVGPDVRVGDRIGQLTIDDAWVVDPATGFEGVASVVIENGSIREVRRRPDAAGEQPALVVAPAFVDLHTHVREAQSAEGEDYASMLAAAAHGGYAWVATLPNTRVAVDRPEVVQRARAAAAAARTPVGTASFAVLTLGQEGTTLAPLAALAAAGVVGFSDDPKGLGDSALLRAALTEAGALQLPVLINADEGSFTAGAEANEGLPATILGLLGASVGAEVSAVSRAISVLRQVTEEAPPDVRPHLHIAHISTAGSLAAIRAAANDGLRVTTDVAPHHLALHDGWIGGDRRYSWDAAPVPWSGQPAEAPPYQPNTRIEPPLRGPEDAIALLAGLEEGTITAIGSSHVPLLTVEQELPFGEARAGAAGLETGLGLVLEAVAAGRLSLRRAMRALSIGPWRAIDGARHGIAEPGLREGAPATLVVFDRSSSWEVGSGTLLSRGKNTPLAGRRLPGAVLLTLNDGRVAYRA